MLYTQYSSNILLFQEAAGMDVDGEQHISSMAADAELREMVAQQEQIER